MNTHVGHHYGSAEDVDKNVSGTTFTSNGKPCACLDLSPSPGAVGQIYFLDSASIDVFAFKLDQLAVEMRKAEHAARQAESAVPA